MAVTRMNEKSSLAISYVDGLDGMGKEKLIHSSYSGIKDSATDQNVYDVAIEFGSLSSKTMKIIAVRENAELTE